MQPKSVQCEDFVVLNGCRARWLDACFASGAEQPGALKS